MNMLCEFFGHRWEFVRVVAATNYPDVVAIYEGEVFCKRCGWKMNIVTKIIPYVKPQTEKKMEVGDEKKKTDCGN